MTSNTRKPARRSVTPAKAAPHAVLFLLCAAAAVAGLIATYVFFVRTFTGQYIDESALDEASRVQAVVGVQVAGFLDALPVTSVIIAALVVLFVCLKRRRWKVAGIAVGAMAAANLCTEVLKFSLPDRPDRGIVTLGLNSLPSGHSTLAASSAAAVFLVVSPRWRPLVGFAGGSYAIFSGVSTVINGWHRPADVVAAFLIVTFWTALAGLVILRTGPGWNVWDGFGEHWAASRAWPLLSLLAAVAAAGMAAVVLQQLTPAGGSRTSTTNYFWTGVALIAVCGYLLTVAGTLVFALQTRRHRPRRRSSRRHMH
ncbi:phosphatase PAP2 family protein [Paenarthrobacter sp. Z7-10]|uniref:phosphatase PAP2 family protein n=1 Tax=Paenarthrobacter sp. Z7-10 TaxID=2787635 RepID=UPI0022A93C20|nr:phosphatase PAP2 family protein [Paenarthrobacter sp. Z7-10]MCZ2402312.1 phosphatase PAP2 family protein [Paenarthrobacter sp. Z7-10]